jgi:hypothetical protein
MALCEAYRLPTPLKVPADDTLLGAYALVRLLLAHPAPWADQPARRFARCSSATIGASRS